MTSSASLFTSRHVAHDVWPAWVTGSTHGRSLVASRKAEATLGLAALARARRSLRAPTFAERLAVARTEFVDHDEPFDRPLVLAGLQRVELALGRG